METINVNDEGAVRVLELNRPEALNAFSNRLMDELTEAFQAAAKESAIKVVVLTGAGRAFSAGADLMEMGQAGDYRVRHGFNGLLDTLVDFPKPFMVAINGVGAGIGATICGLADFAYMAESARLRCPFSALGLTAEAASTYLFPRLMGRQKASWFLLAAEWMSAADCLEAGLVMDVLADEELMPAVLVQAGKLAALPLASLETTKKLIMDPLRMQMRASAKEENAALAAMIGGPANREALDAFRGKRQPDFRGI
jgi:enoyl-CoA hydratase/carnithine racemase